MLPLESDCGALESKVNHMGHVVDYLRLPWSQCVTTIVAIPAA